MNFNQLNEMQRRAVETTEGPVLVLAGAGSGKTSVLTNRVAYLIKEKGVRPYRILALTFTNKAANEMKERIGTMVDYDPREMVISTFHSMCARFLRMDAERIGYQSGFSIYDTANALSIIKKILADMDVDTHSLPPKRALSIISSAKNSADPEQYIGLRAENYQETMLKIYRAYINRLRSENAMDFDDLLLNMLRILKEDGEVREYYTNRFQYILVDEYQDTNAVQYELVRILSEKHKNIFVVGDDDQSIYAWRGADIRNILDFEKDFPGATVIKLEQNYRSHIHILNAANAVISHNNTRKAKQLWSDKKEGEKPFLFTAPSEYSEAEFVAMKINELVREGKRYDDFAILYRMHTQSRVLEEKLRLYSVPYHVYGGTSFYDRKEIKDMVAYLTILTNPSADTALTRIINVPRRGIGDVTMEKILGTAMENGISMLEVIAHARETFGKASFVGKLERFYEDYQKMAQKIEEKTASEVIEDVYTMSGYCAMLGDEGDAEAQVRMENIEELIKAAKDYEATAEEPGIAGFLENVSLINDLDTMEESGSVTLMTLHSAKGLEFHTVFLVGMEESVFPSTRAVEEGQIEEERRLCYVGITRARETLYLTNSERRTLYNGMNRNMPSRFLDEIPQEMLQVLTPRRKKPEYAEPVKPIGMPTFQAKTEFTSKATESIGSFQVGTVVEHPKFGEGTVKTLLGAGQDLIAVVDFPEYGEKKMFLSFAPLKIKG